MIMMVVKEKKRNVNNIDQRIFSFDHWNCSKWNDCRQKKGDPIEDEEWREKLFAFSPLFQLIMSQINTNFHPILPSSFEKIHLKCFTFTYLNPLFCLFPSSLFPFINLSFLLHHVHRNSVNLPQNNNRLRIETLSIQVKSRFLFSRVFVTSLFTF